MEVDVTMRKTRWIPIAFLLAALSGANAQNQVPDRFAGRWWLGFIEEASLPINLTFEATGEGADLLLYSPLQTDQAFVATEWSFAGDTLRMVYDALGMRMTLRWNSADSTFSGTFRQGMLRTDIRFQPADTLFSLVRPQEPQPPYPYREEEVKAVRKKAGVTLSGTLTLPEGKGPFPAVVLISGSGMQNRDEELMGHKPFKVLADWLTRQGIAVLRYDDRGTGGSRGDVEKATTLDLADDAEAMFDLLRKDKRIDSKHIGLAGHSEGGLIASIIAARNKRVGFVVMLAGQGCSGAEVLLQQNGRILQLQGVDTALVAIRVAYLKALFQVLEEVQDDKVQSVAVPMANEFCEGLTTEQRKQIGLRKAEVMMLVQSLQVPWMRTFLGLDNREYLSKVRCPILAVNGDKDCQVVVDNLKMVKSATNGQADTLRMNGLNHLMQHCGTGLADEYFTIEETMAPEVMEALSDWILRIVRK